MNLKDKNLIHCSNLNRDRRVEQNSELKRGNYGRISSNGICFWDGWSGRTRSFGKTNKDPKRKRNSRRELQGRIIHCSVPISHCRVSFSAELESQKSTFKEINFILWQNIFRFFYFWSLENGNT